MSFVSWLKRSFGRTAEGTKAHLVGTAQLLGADAIILERMKNASDEESEQILFESIEGRHGTVVDWKASLEDILENLEYLSDQERDALMRASASLAKQRIYEVPRQLTELLQPPLRALRIVETFGDSYFIFLVPPQLVEAFDRTNKHWLI
ncbi:hypothetical protein [Nitrogeniibacter aestuarii]|uniref:hypothetical protein n=1 Tax=Nitrogeniibacter aestuarii TaxID=2815343 RepID=UPI001E43C34C|nr:hypothetical protein [Nitrogeniibacter aestuarii]